MAYVTYLHLKLTTKFVYEARSYMGRLLLMRKGEPFSMRSVLSQFRKSMYHNAGMIQAFLGHAFFTPRSQAFLVVHLSDQIRYVRVWPCIGCRTCTPGTPHRLSTNFPRRPEKHQSRMLEKDILLDWRASQRLARDCFTYWYTANSIRLRRM